MCDEVDIPAGSAHTHTRTHARTHAHTHTRAHIHHAEFPPLCLVASGAGAHAVLTAHGQCTQYITLFQIHPDHTYYMHCLVFHVCLSRLFGVVVLLVAPAKRNDWASTAYDVIVGAASTHCAQNWANPLVCVNDWWMWKSNTVMCVIVCFIWFMLKWRFVFMKCLLWIGTEIIGTCIVL